MTEPADGPAARDSADAAPGPDEATAHDALEVNEWVSELRRLYVEPKEGAEQRHDSALAPLRRKLHLRAPRRAEPPAGGEPGGPPPSSVRPSPSPAAAPAPTPLPEADRPASDADDWRAAGGSALAAFAAGPALREPAGAAGHGEASLPETEPVSARIDPPATATERTGTDTDPAPVATASTATGSIAVEPTRGGDAEQHHHADAGLSPGAWLSSYLQATSHPADDDEAAPESSPDVGPVPDEEVDEDTEHPAVEPTTDVESIDEVRPEPDVSVPDLAQHDDDDALDESASASTESDPSWQSERFDALSTGVTSTTEVESAGKVGWGATSPDEVTDGWVEAGAARDSDSPTAVEPLLDDGRLAEGTASTGPDDDDAPAPTVEERSPVEPAQRAQADSAVDPERDSAVDPGPGHDVHDTVVEPTVEPESPPPDAVRDEQEPLAADTPQPQPMPARTGDATAELNRPAAEVLEPSPDDQPPYEADEADERAAVVGSGTSAPDITSSGAAWAIAEGIEPQPPSTHEVEADPDLAPPAEPAVDTAAGSVDAASPALSTVDLIADDEPSPVEESAEVPSPDLRSEEVAERLEGSAEADSDPGADAMDTAPVPAPAPEVDSQPDLAQPVEPNVDADVESVDAAAETPVPDLAAADGPASVEDSAEADSDPVAEAMEPVPKLDSEPDLPRPVVPGVEADAGAVDEMAAGVAISEVLDIEDEPPAVDGSAEAESDAAEPSGGQPVSAPEVDADLELSPSPHVFPGFDDGPADEAAPAAVVASGRVEEGAPATGSHDEEVGMSVRKDDLTTAAVAEQNPEVEAVRVASSLATSPVLQEQEQEQEQERERERETLEVANGEPGTPHEEGPDQERHSDEGAVEPYSVVPEGLGDPAAAAVPTLQSRLEDAVALRAGVGPGTVDLDGDEDALPVAGVARIEAPTHADGSMDAAERDVSVDAAERYVSVDAAEPVGFVDAAERHVSVDAAEPVGFVDAAEPDGPEETSSEEPASATPNVPVTVSWRGTEYMDFLEMSRPEVDDTKDLIIVEPPSQLFTQGRRRRPVPAEAADTDRVEAVEPPSLADQVPSTPSPAVPLAARVSAHGPTAAAPAAPTASAGSPKSSGGSALRTALWILLLVVVIAGLAAAAWYFLLREGWPESASGGNGTRPATSQAVEARPTDPSGPAVAVGIGVAQPMGSRASRPPDSNG